MNPFLLSRAERSETVRLHFERANESLEFSIELILIEYWSERIRQPYSGRKMTTSDSILQSTKVIKIDAQSMLRSTQTSDYHQLHWKRVCRFISITFLAGRLWETPHPPSLPGSPLSSWGIAHTYSPTVPRLLYDDVATLHIHHAACSITPKIALPGS